MAARTTGTVFNNGMNSMAEKNMTLLLARQVAAQLKAEGMRRDPHPPRRPGTRAGAAHGARQQPGRRHLSFDPYELDSLAGRSGGAEGVETYILNNATDASSRRLAYLENTVISHEGIQTPEQQDVALILRDMRLDANLAESKRLACTIQNSLGKSLIANRPATGASNRRFFTCSWEPICPASWSKRAFFRAIATARSCFRPRAGGGSPPPSPVRSSSTGPSKAPVPPPSR